MQLISTLDENNCLNIPSQYLKSLNLQSGDEIQIFVEENKLVLIPAKKNTKTLTAIAQAQELVRLYAPRTTSATEELIAERRNAAIYE